MRTLTLTMFPVLIMGCDQNSPTVVFVLPAKVEGVFFVREDQKAGASVVKRGNSIHVKVPSNGIVRLRSLAVFHRWHKLAISLPGARNPVVQGSGEDLPEEAYGCWFLASVPDGTYYYVGKYQDKRRLDRVERPSELLKHLLREPNEAKGTQRKDGRNKGSKPGEMRAGKGEAGKGDIHYDIDP